MGAQTGEESGCMSESLHGYAGSLISSYMPLSPPKLLLEKKGFSLLMVRTYQTVYPPFFLPDDLKEISMLFAFIL